MMAQAKNRVNNDKDLAQYTDIFIDYDWDNMDEHIEWVATADKSELIDWAKSIRKSESESENE